MKNKIKQSFAKIAAGVVSSGLLVCQQASAIPITGEVEMQGVATLNNSSLGSATGVSAATGLVQSTSTGTYQAPGVLFPFSPLVTFSAFGFTPPTTPVNPLWTFSYLGSTYGFNLSSLVVNTHSATFLDISGMGTLYVTGGTYDPTPGNWSFQVTSSSGSNADAKFAFQSSNSAVPDSGLTIALLGFALVGVEGLRRKLRA